MEKEIELIKITKHEGKRAVSARELHLFLEVGKDFSSWIKERIAKYGFVEGQDFTSFTEIGEREIGATIRKEYALSLDMAKELSMVENNERGRMARKYFIECEKKVKEQLSLDDFDKKMKAATWAASFLNMNDASKLLLAKSVLEPLGLPVPDYVASKGVTHSASELLKRHGAGLSAVKFNERLMRLGFLKEETRQGRNGEHRFKVITGRGLDYGENVVSPKSPQETQAHWYDGRFEELLGLIE